MSTYLPVTDHDDQEKYSEPMVWIGIYVAVASLLCILAMAADLLHGFKNRKLWFPSRYFSLNAASITVITVAMKLPLDLSSDMPRYIDQAAKVGSLAFMCTMMANFMPSLAAMDNSTLLANVIGWSILVITLHVNILIDIYTGVIRHINFSIVRIYSFAFHFVMVAYIYTAMNLFLLIIMISSSLTIPTSKEILEVKYQTTNKSSLNEQHLQDAQMSIVEKLRQHVRKYWVMAETGSPQFVMACNPLSTASGVICVFVLLLNSLMVIRIPFGEEVVHSTSVYKWSILFIVRTQSIGVVVGTIAPLFRCFSVLSFKIVTKRNKNHLMLFEVESYWTQKLCEWKQSPIHFLSSSRSRTLIYNSKGMIISLCIIIQKVIVILCKVISLIPIIIPTSIVYCLCCWKSLKARLVTSPVISRTNNTNKDISNYVLQIHDEVELAEIILTRISNSMNAFILKAEKEQSKDLLELLDKSTGFNGVNDFDTNDIQPLLSVELVNTWSLPIVTLTCIAVALPNIHKDSTKSLLRSVREGLSYTHLVEESLNHEIAYVKIRKAAMILWNEFEQKSKWLNKALEKDAFIGKTAREILKWFSNKAKEIVREIIGGTGGEMVENTRTELIAANSMYRLVETILLRDEGNTEHINEEQLFALLNGIIADILCACFTNIPRVITTKCHESVIEKREASVKAAAKLLGKTTKIIEKLDTHELPSMDPDKMPYIDEWRFYLKQSIP